jgi:hypothetical protein
LTALREQRDGNPGEALLLGELPADINIVPEPGGDSFAFLHQDRCGTTVSSYDPDSGDLSRAPVSVEGEGHLIWGETLMVVDDQSEKETPRWVFTPVEGWKAGEPVVLPLERSIRWGRLIGYSESQGAYLLRSSLGELLWLARDGIQSGREESLRVADLELSTPAWQHQISKGGQWLALAEPQNNGTIDLYALDLISDERIWLARLSPGVLPSSLAFGPGFPVPFVFVTMQQFGELEPHSFITYFASLPPTGRDGAVTSYRVEGIVDELYWCDDGRILYRVTGQDEQRLVEGLGEQARTLAEYGQVIGCIPP